MVGFALDGGFISKPAACNLARRSHTAGRQGFFLLLRSGGLTADSSSHFFSLAWGFQEVCRKVVLLPTSLYGCQVRAYAGEEELTAKLDPFSVVETGP